MKIARFTEGGRTRLGIVTTDTDEIIDVGRPTRRCRPTSASLLADGQLPSFEAAAAPRFPLDQVRLEAPIAQPADASSRSA